MAVAPAIRPRFPAATRVPVPVCAQPRRAIPRPAAVMLLLVYASSFLPYLLPLDERPALYADGLTAGELRDRRHAARLERFLGGDVQSIPWDEEGRPSP